MIFLGEEPTEAMRPPIIRNRKLIRQKHKYHENVTKNNRRKHFF